MRLDPKSITCGLLSSADVSFFHRTFYRNYVTILMYHGVSEAPLPFYNWTVVDKLSFQSQMKYLKRNFEVVPLSSLPGMIARPVSGKPLAVVTFDDGYQNNFDVAYPVLCEEKVPATIFLTTGLVDTNSTTWTCRLHDAVENTDAKSLKWNSSVYSLDTVDARQNAISIIKTHLKRISHHEALECVRDILVRLGVDPNKKFGTGSPYRMLSSVSIRAMLSSGLVEFGGHTSTHPILSRLSAKDQEREIGDCVEAVSRLSGAGCSTFAYPNGSPEDYNNDSVRILRDLGVTTAVTTIEGYNTGKTPMLELRRSGVGAGDSMAQFKIAAHHLRTLLRKN